MDKFCTKCGQKLAENATFCTSCGSRVETQEKTMQEQSTSGQSTYTAPNQATYTAQNQASYTTPNQNVFSNPIPNMYGGVPNPNMYPNQNVDPKVASKNSLATALGIIALVLSLSGSLLFGIILSIPALILGIISVIMAINVKKATSNVKGTPAMICGIIAIIFASIFTIGCTAVDCSDPTESGIGKYGCVGGYCSGSVKFRDAYHEVWDEDDWEDLFDY